MFSLLRQLKNNPFYRLPPFVSSFRSGNEFSFTQVRDDFKLGRWMNFYSFLSHGSESRSHFSTKSVPFSSDKDASEGSTSAVENGEANHSFSPRIEFLKNCK
ncbi:hypothetical protein YC2023_109295 [Brassica napus]